MGKKKKKKKKEGKKAPRTAAVAKAKRRDALGAFFPPTTIGYGMGWMLSVSICCMLCSSIMGTFPCAHTPTRSATFVVRVKYARLC